MLAGASYRRRAWSVGLAAAACLSFSVAPAIAGTERVSVSSSGAEGFGGDTPVFSFDVSADGRFVAFDSRAAGLADGGTPDSGSARVTDIFVRDRVAGTTERITSAVDRDSQSIYPALS